MTDKSNLEVQVIIDASSINTGDSDRDKDLKGKGYFNIEKYPQITFESIKTIRTKEGFIVKGNFTMMGKTSEIEIPFTFKHDPSVVWVFGEPRIAAVGIISIDRTEYGIPQRGWDNIVPSLGSISLSKDVKVKLLIQGVGPSLSDLVQEKISNHSVKAGTMLYDQLEKEESGKGTYTFGARALVGIVMQLTRDGKNSEAIEMGEFTSSQYGDSFFSWYALAGAHEAAGNKEKAISLYYKTLELNPKFPRAQSAIDRLEK